MSHVGAFQESSGRLHPLCASITARDLTQNVARLGVIEFGSKALSRQLALAPSCAPLARGRRRLRLKFL